MIRAIIIMILWYVGGLIIITAIDDEDKHIWKWIQKAPLKILQVVAVALWPLIFYFYLKAVIKLYLARRKGS